jgi:hypothetical protein
MMRPPLQVLPKLGFAFALAAGAAALSAWPLLKAGSPEPPAAVWIDFGTTHLDVKTQALRSPAEGYVGVAQISANGTTRVAKVLQTLVVPKEPEADGYFHATGTHAFTFEDGSGFTTVDELLLIPTGGEGQFDAYGVLAAGGGLSTLTGLTGTLDLQGQVDLVKGQLSAITTGKVQK